MKVHRAWIFVSDGLLQCADAGFGSKINLGRCPTQGLADHIGRGDSLSKDLCRNIGNGLGLVERCACGLHRC